MSTVALALRVLRAEGPAAARDRLLDRFEEWRWRSRFSVMRRDRPSITVPLLDVLSTPPARRLGGVPIQFLPRWEREGEERTCALFHPERGGYRLLRRSGDRRDTIALPTPRLALAPALRDAAFECALGDAANATGVRVLHLEGIAGLPLESILELARSGMRLVLSLHDFSLFCLRPHLLEEPAGTFCNYSHDHDRCHACLRSEWNVTRDFQRRYRELGAELLRRAEAVVYPSSFLRSKLAELVPHLDSARQRVIEPGGPPPPSPSGPADPRVAIRHVAFVGAVRRDKGAAVFEQVVRGLATAGLRWTVLGGGDPHVLRRLRRLARVTVRGYYRAFRLPGLLREHDVDLALLPSIVPESYGLTFDECRAAGVPVIAFDHGAIAERVRRDGGGLLVAPEAGAEGVLATLREVCDGRRSLPPPTSAATRRHTDAARAYIELYRELGFIPRP